MSRAVAQVGLENTIRNPWPRTGYLTPFLPSGGTRRSRKDDYDESEQIVDVAFLRPRIDRNCKLGHVCFSTFRSWNFRGRGLQSMESESHAAERVGVP